MKIKITALLFAIAAIGIASVFLVPKIGLVVVPYLYELVAGLKGLVLLAVLTALGSALFFGILNFWERYSKRKIGAPGATSGNFYGISWTTQFCIITALILVGYHGWDEFTDPTKITITAIGAFSSAIGVFAIVSPIFKDVLLHNPDYPGRIGMYVKVGTSRNVSIDFGNTFYYSIDGDDYERRPVPAHFLPWYLYKQYIMLTTRYHVYLPFLTEPKSYDLTPRRRLASDDGGKVVYELIREGDKGFRSNHVRTAPTTWLFRYGGAEIEKLPFAIQGSLQISINKNKVRDALYLTESWNVLLNQALNSVIVAVVRTEINIDMVLGKISQNLWDEPPKKSNLYGFVAKLIYEALMDYHFSDKAGDEHAGKTLADLAITIYRVDITDIDDELSPQERTGLRASTLGREQGRARHLNDQGIALGQESMLEVLKDNTDLAKDLLKSRAYVDALEKANTLEALFASLIQKNLHNDK